MVLLTFLGMSLSSVFLGGAATWHQGSMHASTYISISVNDASGSAVDVMVAFFAAMGNNVDAAQAMLLGPMLSCLLFVLGSHCIYDGWEQKKLAFGSMAPHACASLDRWALCPCPADFPRCLAELSDQGGAASDRARRCDVRWRADLIMT